MLMSKVAAADRCFDLIDTTPIVNVWRLGRTRYAVHFGHARCWNGLWLVFVGCDGIICWGDVMK
jgi:hypothetical protein